MDFSTLLNFIIESFNNTFELITPIFELIMENSFIKLIIFIVLFVIVIEYVFKIINILFNVFNLKEFGHEELTDKEIMIIQREKIFGNHKPKKATKKQIKEIEDLFENL